MILVIHVKGQQHLIFILKKKEQPLIPLGIDRYFLNWINYIYFNPKSIIILNGEAREAFLVISETDNEVHYHHYYLTLFCSTDQFI